LFFIPSPKQGTRLDNVSIYIVVGVFTYIVVQCFFDIYETAVDAIIIGYCANCENDDGHCKLLYMAVELVVFLEKSY
jgi:Plasma-membrane choline transporter